MPKYKCSFPSCTYEIDEVADELAALLLSVYSAGTHTTVLRQLPNFATTAKIERVWHPTVSAVRLSEEWAYFLTHWQDYVEATKVAGKDKVVQLLERCDEQLRKHLSRNAGASLIPTKLRRK